MKKTLYLIITIVLFLGKTSFAQITGNTTQISELLNQYYAVKDALVSNNATMAAQKSSRFLKSLNEIDTKQLPEASRSALLKDAANISKTKDLKKQRELFSSFSDNMFALAKTTKLSAEPIYIAYCPMKKASWLSKEAAIKNPYYGSSMLTCGNIAETIK